MDTPSGVFFFVLRFTEAVTMRNPVLADRWERRMGVAPEWQTSSKSGGAQENGSS
jgi:hypothetical protein